MAKLYFKYGAMGSSKTAQALVTKYNYEERNMKVLFLKPSTDTRDGADVVRSRIGLEAKAIVLTPEEDAYRLRLRLATFTSSMGIYGSQLIPWHCFPVFFAGIASAVYPIRYFSPLDILSRNYLGWLIVGTALLLTFTGWDRFVPGFGLPRTARLRSKK